MMNTKSNDNSITNYTRDYAWWRIFSEGKKNPLVTIPKFYGVSDLVGDKMSILKVVFIYFMFEIDVSHKNVINEFIEFENSVATAAL